MFFKDLEVNNGKIFVLKKNSRKYIQKLQLNIQFFFEHLTLCLLCTTENLKLKNIYTILICVPNCF